MAITVYPTGPYNSNSLSGIQNQFPYATFNYCSPLITTPSAYQSVAGGVSGTGVCNFGAMLSQIYITNTGSGDLAFQWKEQFGQEVDGGYVPSKTTVRVDRTVKTGLAVRSADPGTPTTCVVWGI